MTTHCAHCQQPLHPSWGAQFMTCPHCGGYVELFEANGKLYAFAKENPHKKNGEVERKQPNSKQELILQRQYLQNQILILQQDWALEQEKHRDEYKYYTSLEEFKRMNAKTRGCFSLVSLIILLLFFFFTCKYLYSDQDESLLYLYFIVFLLFLLFFSIVLLFFHGNKIPPYFIKLGEFEAKRDELGKALKKIEQELERL